MSLPRVRLDPLAPAPVTFVDRLGNALAYLVLFYVVAAGATVALAALVGSP